MKKKEFKAYDLDDYPDVDHVDFPNEISIAYSVCGKQCGNSEFIVDGSSQVCQHCGMLLFRTVVKKYKLDKDKGDGDAG
jgi:hypothetical protein